MCVICTIRLQIKHSDGCTIGVQTAGNCGPDAGGAAGDDGDEVTTIDISPKADLVVDITDSAAVNAAAAELGAVNILVNSAGVIGRRKPLWELTDDEWSGTHAVNLDGTFNLCRAFVPGMRELGWGRIVNFSAVAGKFGNPDMSAYSASKAA